MYFLFITTMSLQQAVNAFATEASDDHLPIVELLTEKKASLLDVVKASQLFITNSAVNVRSRAFFMLAKVLESTPRGLLYSKDISVLITFLLSKFNDDPMLVLTNVLSCFVSLVQMDQYTPNDALLQHFIDDYNPRQFTAAVRALPLQLAVVLPQIDSHPSFIKFFLSVSQNEKDPKNLLILFQVIDRITSSNLDLSDHVNELFDCIFKYYPISFKSSNDTQLIQINSLKRELNRALASSELFASDLFINLIDKFNTSSSPNTKLDILETLKTAFNSFSTTTIESHFIQLWNTLKYEVLNFDLAQIIGQKSVLQYYLGSSNDNDIVFGKTLTILQLLFEKSSGQDDLLLLVYDDLKKNLDPSTASNKFNQSCLILSLIVNQSIIDQTLFTMVNQDFARTSSKKQILVSLTYFSNLNQSNFLKYQNEIFTILHSSLCVSDEESNLIAMACQSTVQFLLIQDFLLDERQFLLKTLSDLLISSQKNSIVNKTIVESISKLSLFPQFDDLLLNEVYTPLLVQARTSVSALDVIVSLTSTPSLVNSISIRLLNSSSLTEIPIVDVLNTVYKLLLKLELNSSLDQFMKFVPTLLSISHSNESKDIITFYIGLILRRMAISISNDNIIQLLTECQGNLTFTLFIIQSLPKSNPPPSLDFKDILNKSIDQIPRLSHTLQLIHLSSCSNIINKYLTWETITPHLQPADANLTVWLIRGLVFKNDTSAMEFAINLLNTTNELSHCKTILRVLFQDIPEHSPSNLDVSLEVIYRRKEQTNELRFNNSAVPITNWNIRPVWKQRLFQMIKDSPNSNSEVMILLLMKLPEEVYATSMDSITPLLMKSLDVKDVDVTIGEFKIFTEIIKADGGDQLKIHIDSIFNRCMELLSIECSDELKETLWVFLETLTGFKHSNVLVPFREKIIKRCANSILLGNSRRVRMHIVQCRQGWETWTGSPADLTPGDHHGHSH